MDRVQFGFLLRRAHNNIIYSCRVL